MATGSISSLGVGSGLELQSMLDQLRAVDDQAINTKKAAVTTYENQLNEFTVVNNKLLAMKSSALDLSLSSSFLSRTVTSSSESVLTTTVVDATAAQSVGVTVDRLATKSTWISEGKAASTTSINTDVVAKPFTYHVGTGDAVTLAVPADTTLSELVDLINNDINNPGVTASLINDGSAVAPYKLVLKSDTLGSDGEIAITTELPDLAMTAPTVTGTALNAQLVVDGVTYQRKSNTFSDVISGVTVALQGAGSSTVTVANNDDALVKMVQDFVSAYNDVVQEVSSNTAYNEDTNDFGILARTTLRDLPYALQNLMSSSVTADSKGLVNNMFDLGLEINRDGTISINSAILTAAVAASPDSVSAFFLGDSDKEIAGFADTVNEYLRTMTSGTGQVAAEKTAAQSRIDDINLQIEEMTARIDKRYDILTKQFVALDQYMSQMKSMGNYLTGQFDSLSSMLSGNSSN